MVCNITKKFEVAKYFTQLNYAQGLFIWIFNKAWFNSLPADLQKTFTEVVHDVCKDIRSQTQQQEIDQIAAASAIAATDLGAWSYDLTVTGLRGAADYEACLAWLQALSIVERVSVRAAAPAQVTFRLDLTAMPRYLEDAIANGRLLEYDAEQDRYRMRGVADER